MYTTQIAVLQFFENVFTLPFCMLSCVKKVNNWKIVSIVIKYCLIYGLLPSSLFDEHSAYLIKIYMSFI